MLTYNYALYAYTLKILKWVSSRIACIPLPFKFETMFLKSALSCCSVLILMDAVHKTSLYMSSDLYITSCAGYSVQSSCPLISFSYGCCLISWRWLDSLMPSLLKGLWNPYPLLKLSPEIKYTFKFIFVFQST